nr:hypothetical protein BaRGS_029600 [Batillaria attramentaria]
MDSQQNAFAAELQSGSSTEEPKTTETKPKGSATSSSADSAGKRRLKKPAPKKSKGPAPKAKHVSVVEPQTSETRGRMEKSESDVHPAPDGPSSVAEGFAAEEKAVHDNPASNAQEVENQSVATLTTTGACADDDHMTHVEA